MNIQTTQKGARVNCVKDGHHEKGAQKVDTIKAKSAGEMGMKFLSLGEAQTLEGTTLAKAKDALYRQLIGELETVCGK